MKIYAYIIIIKLLYFHLTSCDANIKCNGTILFDHYNVSASDQKEKKLDIYCGEELMLICQLDEISLRNGCLSTNLTYEFGIGDMPPETTDTKLVNDKTLQLKMITNKPAGFTVTCLYNGKGLNSLVMAINVGHEPQPIEMQCLIYPQMEKLRCEFEMSGNPVLEKYTILYSNHSARPAIYIPAVFEMKDKKRKWATDLAAHQQFDQFGKYTFLVTGTNRFGVLPQNFTFHTEQIVVIPDQKSVKIQSIQAKSVIAEIILPATVKLYEFIYNATACTVRCDKEKSWSPVNVTDITTNATQTDFILNLTISPLHAYQSYKLRIKIQLKDALYPMKQQTIVRLKTFKTLECPPENPPTTFTNGFEIHEDNKVIVYWKEILDMHKNGPEFTYEISEIYENGLKLLSPSNLTILSNSAGRLRNFDRNKNYTIRMVSRNSAGVSANRSDVIEIPKATEWVSPPTQMRKTIYNDNYDLSWNVSPSHDIVSYTIYWCSSLDELQTMCGTLLGYKILPAHETTFQYYNMPKSGMKNFAIATNTKNSSSGLFWFTCPEKDIPEVTRITHANITLTWKMSCHTNRKNHVVISYSECAPNTDATCGTNKKMAMTSIYQESLTLSKLNRCTSYLIKIIIQDFNANSTHPTVVKAKTTKGMPPIPMALASGIITNTTIEISWSLPYECPGPMRYEITYNELNLTIVQRNGLKSYTIQNLSSFSTYDIKLAACYDDTQCSNFSKAINIKTKYGTPAGIEKLINNVNNNDLTYYSWQPTLQNAEHQYYEIKHISTQDGVDTELTSIVLNPKCTLVKNPCGDGMTSFKYFVRVINVDRTINNSYYGQMNDTFNPDICFEEVGYTTSTLCDRVTCLLGEWDKFRDFNCFPGNLVMKFSLILVVVFAFGAGLCAGIVVGIRKYRSIKNVGHVSMPDGLDNIFKSLSNLIPKLEIPAGVECDEPKQEYCTYEYIFSSANRLDEISVTETVATVENLDEYLEYSCDVVPLPNPGNYVKLNDLQYQMKIPTSGYTSISALQSHTLLTHSAQQKIPNHNGYLPVSAISTISTPGPPVKMTGYVPIQMLHAMKPQVTTASTGYTPVSALQHNSTKLPAVSTNGYITIAALQSQTS